MSVIHRRQYLTGAAQAACFKAIFDFQIANRPVSAQEIRLADRRNLVHGFSKHFQDLDAADLSTFAIESGWDGVDLTYRKGGHVEPDDSPSRLAEFVKVLRKNGLSIEIATTDVKEIDSKRSDRIVRSLADLGFKSFRLSYWTYDLSRPISEQLDQLRREWDNIARFCRTVGITAGYQNHSGAAYVGAGLWDLWYCLRDFSPSDICAMFDVGHAIVENALAWPAISKLLLPHIRCLYVKDFVWDSFDKTRSVKWCPLGEGCVPHDIFQLFVQTKWNGPISLHHEYNLPVEPTARLEMSRRDTRALESAFSE